MPGGDKMTTGARVFTRGDALRWGVVLLVLAFAAGAYVSYGLASPGELATVAHFGQLRDGTMHVFDLGNMQGLVSLPSYHTALALIFVRSMRWTRVGFVVACVLIGLMILSTPTEGGHYLVDMAAGVGLWALPAGMLLAFAGRRMPATIQQMLIEA